MHLLELFGMNRLLSTRIQQESLFSQELKFQWRTFRKGQDEVIAGFNKNNWLAIEISKFGQGSAKMCIDSCCVFRLIGEQCEAIGRLHQTIHNYTKVINIMSNTMDGMGKDLHNMRKEMEY